MKTKEELVRLAQRKLRCHFQLFNVEVRLVEAVEEHQRIRTRDVELLRNVGRSLKKWDSLTATGMRTALFSWLHQIAILAFSLPRPCAFGSARKEIKV